MHILYMNQTCVVNNKAVRQRQLRLTRGSRNPSRPRTPNQTKSPATRELYPNRKLRGSSGVRNPKTQNSASPIQRTLRTPQGKRKVK